MDAHVKSIKHTGLVVADYWLLVKKTVTSWYENENKQSKTKENKGI